jgi:hypothetical protein
MSTGDERIEHAVANTEILRAPKQTLSTFGTTNVYYYLLTEPAYSEMSEGAEETVIREGRVIAEKPRIVTPYYLSHLEGFSWEARRYLDTLIKAYGSDAPGLIYTYRNEPKGLNISAEGWRTVLARLNENIDRRKDLLTAVVRGEDELWDVSLLKFIYEMVRSSFPRNLSQMGARGLLEMDAHGVPMDARLRIEEMFRQALKGDLDPAELKKELDRWNLFADYEDRFFAIFRKK